MLAGLWALGHFPSACHHCTAAHVLVHTSPSRPCATLRAQTLRSAACISLLSWHSPTRRTGSPCRRAACERASSLRRAFSRARAALLAAKPAIQNNTVNTAEAHSCRVPTPLGQNDCSPNCSLHAGEPHPWLCQDSTPTTSPPWPPAAAAIGACSADLSSGSHSASQPGSKARPHDSIAQLNAAPMDRPAYVCPLPPTLSLRQSSSRGKRRRGCSRSTARCCRRLHWQRVCVTVSLHNVLQTAALCLSLGCHTAHQLQSASISSCASGSKPGGSCTTCIEILEELALRPSILAQLSGN